MTSDPNAYVYLIVWKERKKMKTMVALACGDGKFNVVLRSRVMFFNSKEEAFIFLELHFPGFGFEKDARDVFKEFISRCSRDNGLYEFTEAYRLSGVKVDMLMIQ